MGTDNLNAPDLIVARGWQPMDTFPRDGTMVEVTDAVGNISKAQWMANVDRIATQGINPINWRYPEE